MLQPISSPRMVAFKATARPPAPTAVEVVAGATGAVGGAGLGAGLGLVAWFFVGQRGGFTLAVAGAALTAYKGGKAMIDVVKRIAGEKLTPRKAVFAGAAGALVGAALLGYPMTAGFVSSMAFSKAVDLALIGLGTLAGAALGASGAMGLVEKYMRR